MIFHVFWDGILSERLLLVLHSYLATQSLNCSNIVLWTSTQHRLQDWHNSIYKDTAFRKHRNNILLRFFNVVVELTKINVLLASQEHNTMKRVSIDLENPVTSSDMFRFVVLFNYGGIYIDADFFCCATFSLFIFTNLPIGGLFQIIIIHQF